MKQAETHTSQQIADDMAERLLHAMELYAIACRHYGMTEQQTIDGITNVATITVKTEFTK